MTNLYYDPRGKSDKPISGMVNGKPRIMPGFEKYFGITRVRRGAHPGAIAIDHDSVGQPDRLVRNNHDSTFTAVPFAIAVGTVVADRPPHRSVREALPHTAPTLSRA